MPLIELETLIHAAPERCFDLSLNIDLHMESMHQTNEKAIGGITAGQIKLGEQVKWKARHFGLHFTMTVGITDLLRFQSPLWLVGFAADKLFLKTYMRNLLLKRNSFIKEIAEHGAHPNLKEPVHQLWRWQHTAVLPAK